MSKIPGTWRNDNSKILKDLNCPSQANCFEILQLALDGEICETQRGQFEKQITSCMPCFKKYNLDNAIRLILKSRLENKTAPKGLAESIIDQIKNAKELNG